MAQIYKAPDEIPVPTYFGAGPKDFKAAEKVYIDTLKNHLITNGLNGEHVGEVIAFPVADGKALYMVAKLSPLSLIHLPIGDAWEFEFVDRLTKKDVLKKIEQQKALNKLFSK